MAFALPTHLRLCAETLGITNPQSIATVGALLVAYGVERGNTQDLKACNAEILRLIDVHNAAMTSGELAVP